MSDTQSEDRVVIDARGRKLLIHEMDPADQLDLFEACAGNSGNMSWVGMALLVCSVKAIDDVPIAKATNPTHVKIAAKKLGKDGIAAVSEALNPTQDTQADEQAMAKN